MKNETQWPCEECSLKEVDIEFLQAKIRAMERSFERIAGKCGIPDASDACHQIMKECQRVLKNLKQV